MDRGKHKQILLIATFVVLIVIYLENCKDSSTGPQYSLDDIQTIIPLKVGASWTYRQIDVDYQASPAVQETTIVTRKVIEAFDSLSRKFFRIERSFHGFISYELESITREKYVKHEVSMYSNGQPIYDSHAILRKPLIVSNRWYFNDEDTTVEGSLQITNLDTIIRISNSAYYYTTIAVKAIPTESGIEELWEYYIAPTIGIVYERVIRVYQQEPPKTTLSRELISVSF